MLIYEIPDAEDQKRWRKLAKRVKNAAVIVAKPVRAVTQVMLLGRKNHDDLTFGTPAGRIMRLSFSIIHFVHCTKSFDTRCYGSG